MKNIKNFIVLSASLVAISPVILSTPIFASPQSGVTAVWTETESSSVAGILFEPGYVTDGNGGTFCASWSGTEDTKKIAMKLGDEPKLVNRLTFTGYFNWMINKVNVYTYKELPDGVTQENDWSNASFGDASINEEILSWNGAGAQTSSNCTATIEFDDTEAKYIVIEVLEGKAYNDGTTSTQFSVGEIDASYFSDDDPSLRPQIDPSSTNVSNRLGNAVLGSESESAVHYYTGATDKKVNTTWIAENSDNMLVVKLDEQVTSISDMRLTGFDTWIPTEVEVYGFDDVPDNCTEDDWTSVTLNKADETLKLNWDYYTEGESASTTASAKATFSEPITAKYVLLKVAESKKYDGTDGNKAVSIGEVTFGKTDNRETSSDWYKDSKYELMVTYAWSGECYPLTRTEGGAVPASIDQLANALDVDKFADDCVRFGFDTVSFSAWHACMNPVYPSTVMQGWRGEGHSSQRDLLGEVIHALKERDINVMLYVHPSDGHDMTATDQAMLGWDDPNNDVIPEKWNDFINAMFEEIGERYGKDIDGYWFDGGGLNIDVQRLKGTLKKYNPNAVYYWGTDRNHGTPPVENWIVRGRNESTYFGGLWWGQAVGYDGRRWGDSTAEYMYKYTVAMSATQSIGDMECGLPFIGNLQWGATPYASAGNNWEPGVEDTMLKVADMMAEVDGSINGTRPSSAFTTFEGDTINSEGGFVATESKDGKTTYVHVLVPPSDSKTIRLGVPSKQTEFADTAVIYNNNQDKGKQVKVNVNDSTGEMSLTLPEDVEWNGYQTVIALTTEENGIIEEKPLILQPNVNSVETSSSKYYEPKTVIDGAAGDGNGWHTADNVTDAYLTIDLKSNKALSKMVLYTRSGYEGRFLKEYDVYLSDEKPTYNIEESGEDHYVKASVSGIKGDDILASGAFDNVSSSNEILFDNIAEGRYLTIHVKNVQDGGDCINISEIGLYERNMEYPTAPVNVQAEANDSEIRLTWDAPKYPGTSEIQKYQVRCGESEWMDADSDSSHTFKNLENGKEYVVKVRAVNETTYGEYAKTTAEPQEKEKADKSKLDKLVNEAEQIDIEKYTEKSVKAFQIALAEARKVLANAALSVDDQELVDQSAKALENAMDKLVLKDTEDAGDSGDNDKSDSDNAGSKGDNGKPDSDNADSQKDKNNGSSTIARKDVPQTGDSAGGLFAAAAFAVVSAGVIAGKVRKRDK